MATISDTPGVILVDAHVHIYPCFDLAPMLDAIYANFRAETSRRNREKHFNGVCLLTEKSGDNYFQKLVRRADDPRLAEGPETGDWKFRRTLEAYSLKACSEDGRRMDLIAGRQVVTQEGLEVLALITETGFDDGLPIVNLIAIMIDSGAIPVLPWGVGKWLGSRGERVASLLGKGSRHRIFLGDNSGRPGFLPAPRLFRVARSSGIKILPGTDPLPIASEGTRCGSFGFAISGTLSEDRPGENLAKLLADRAVVIDPYGELENPLRFFRNQLLIRIRNDL